MKKYSINTNWNSDRNSKMEKIIQVLLSSFITILSINEYKKMCLIDLETEIFKTKVVKLPEKKKKRKTFNKKQFK
jgi:hypothetical protein